MPVIWLSVALGVAACGGDDESTPGLVEGTDVEAAQENVRNAFADPALLCGELSSDRYVKELGGRAECMSQAGAVSEDTRVEGEGFTIGDASETPGGATVTVETPDFGRYVYRLVEEDGALLIDSVSRESPGSPASGDDPE